MSEKFRILIVIDMQKDFVDGSLGTPEAQAIVPAVEARISDGDYDGIIFTYDTHYENYMDTLEGKKLPVPHCIDGTEGWKPAVRNAGVPGSRSVIKNTFGSLTLDAAVREIMEEYAGRTGKSPRIGNTEFIMCGLCTDICVISNALILRAKYPDNIITVDARCCAGTTPEAHRAALTVMRSCQIDVINDEQ